MVGSDSYLKKLVVICSLLVFSVIWYNFLLYLQFYPGDGFFSILGYISVLILGISIVLLMLANWIESGFWGMISYVSIWLSFSFFVSWICYHLLRLVQSFIPILNDMELFPIVLLSFILSLYFLQPKLIKFTFEDILETLTSNDTTRFQ